MWKDSPSLTLPHPSSPLPRSCDLHSLSDRPGPAVRPVSPLVVLLSSLLSCRGVFAVASSSTRPVFFFVCLFCLVFCSPGCRACRESVLSEELTAYCLLIYSSVALLGTFSFLSVVIQGLTSCLLDSKSLHEPKSRWTHDHAIALLSLV